MGFGNSLRQIWNNHFLMMVLCCAVPLVLVVVLYALGFSGYAFWLVLLLCPLMHLLMMKGMGKHGHQVEDDADSGGDAKCH